MTNQDRKLAIQMHNNGHSYAQLAEHFSVNKNTIRELVKKHELKKGLSDEKAYIVNNKHY